MRRQRADLEHLFVLISFGDLRTYPTALLLHATAAVCCSID